MLRKLLPIFVVVIALAGCGVGKRIDGNTVNYAPGITVFVDGAYTYTGAFQVGQTGGLQNTIKNHTILAVNDVFVKLYNNTNEIIELVALNQVTPGDRVVWAVQDRGRHEDKFFAMDQPPKEYLNHFLTKGYVMAKGFQCVETLRMTEARVHKSLTYCVSSNILPAEGISRPVLLEKSAAAARVVQ